MKKWDPRSEWSDDCGHAPMTPCLATALSAWLHHMWGGCRSAGSSWIKLIKLAQQAASALKGVWRNGSASDSRSEGWEFESLCPHLMPESSVAADLGEAVQARRPA